MNKKALLESALFVSDKPLPLDYLVKVVDVTEEEILKLLSQIKQDLEKQDRGVELIESPEGFEFRVKPEYRERVARLAPFADLGEGMMRCLAIVAAKQPVKQSLIVRYQGNKAYGYIAQLEEKGLIKTEKFGRTKLVSTASDFEKYFGKTSEEIKGMLKEEK